MSDDLTCELCGLPITDDDYHDGEDGECYHEECCPACNGAEWKQQRDELLEACIIMYTLLQRGHGRWTIEQQNQAAAAIAKAKGQTEL